MLTLCELAAPVSIRPPQSPQLKPFTFFMSRARQPDGSERLYLNMGYFETLTDAQKWMQVARGRYPNAIATLAPDASLRKPESDLLGEHRRSLGADPTAPPRVAPVSPMAPPAGLQRGVPETHAVAPVEDESLTDTQVMRILDTRRIDPALSDADERNSTQIALLRPEDTSTRHALKEAVVQGAPVSFAVQLHWSAQPIDLSRVPTLDVFKAYTLYATESRREGRSRFFLRLGFFKDPVSAKEVAFQVRSNFASAAVVPVTEPELTRAREARMEPSAIPYLVQQPVDQALDSSRTPGSAAESKPPSNGRRTASRRAETLEQTLERLAQREMWTEPDSLSETGVRHLKVEVQERKSGRS